MPCGIAGHRASVLLLARENGETALSIEDDGRGLSERSRASGGMGLRTMRYRAGLIGGKLGAWPRPGRRDAGCMPGGCPPPPPKMRNSKSNRRRS